MKVKTLPLRKKGESIRHMRRDGNSGCKAGVKGKKDSRELENYVSQARVLVDNEM